MTPAMKATLKWLRSRGGDGVFAGRDRQVLLAKGDRAPIMRSTWNKLAAAGMVEGYGRRRLKVTALGLAYDLSKVTESSA